MRLRLLLVIVLASCARPSPRVPFGQLDGGLEAFLAAHAPAPGQNIRIDEVGRTATASYHVAQIEGAETPHRHPHHDLTVTVLRGEGTLTLGARRVALRAGDVAVIARGEPHWFARTGRTRAVSFVAFTPPLDAPDSVPLAVDSPGNRE